MSRRILFYSTATQDPRKCDYKAEIEKAKGQMVPRSLLLYPSSRWVPVSRSNSTCPIYVVKSGLDNKMLHRNREFLKQAERPAEQPKPVEGSDSQSLQRMKASL